MTETHSQTLNIGAHALAELVEVLDGSVIAERGRPELAQLRDFICQVAGDPSRQLVVSAGEAVIGDFHAVGSTASQYFWVDVARSVCGNDLAAAIDAAKVWVRDELEIGEALAYETREEALDQATHIRVLIEAW